MILRFPTYLLVFSIMFGCTTIDQSQPRGFGGYSFHSEYLAIKGDMDRSGYALVDSADDGLWYDGNLLGYPIQFSYEFSHGELTGGYFDVLELSEDSWLSVNQYLLDTYPHATTEICKSNHKFCRIFCTVDAKIVHLLTNDHEVHVVRYYERSPQNDCHSELGIDVVLNTDIKP